MKNFFVLVAFITTVIFGLMLSSAANPYFVSSNILHRNCVRSGEETTGKSLFTLEEVNNLVRKKVISTNPEFKFGETGRIISFEMVGTDKFLIEIYWGKGATDENSSVTFHDKEWFSKDFEILD